MPVPVLPHRGGAAHHHRQPRRGRVLEEQLVRDVEVPGVGEHRQQVRRREEAGAEVGPGLSDQLDEARGGAVAGFVVDQSERQCAHVVGLRVRRQAPFGVDVFGSPRIRGARREVFEALCLVVVPEQPADPRHERRGMVEERGRHVALIGLPLATARLEPLAPVESRVPQVGLVRCGIGSSRRALRRNGSSAPRARRTPPIAPSPATALRARRRRDRSGTSSTGP